MSVSLLASALLNLALGGTTLFWAFVCLWAVNGWFQSVGSRPAITSSISFASSTERASGPTWASVPKALAG